MSKEKKLRILCFGDSLTAGYYRGGAFHPYETKLAEGLSAARPDLDIETVEDGVSGDVTGFFPARALGHFDAGMPKYDWTIVLGGTNDLAYGYSAEAIFENLQRVWKIAISYGSRVLALTVPEVAAPSYCLSRTASARRDALNKLIRDAAGGQIYVHDHHAAVPWQSLSEHDRLKYWDDNVHLSPDGYDLMGKKIAERLLEIMHEEEGGTAAAPAKDEVDPMAASTSRRPGFRDDDKVFDEEDGGASKLARGYVVVRRKDLD